jgi:enamine deaminase RidA (YjgF/YER057c/UK114 family)
MKKAIYPENWQKTRGTYSPAMEIDLGAATLMFVSGQQAGKNDNNEAFTSDIEKQTEDVFMRINEVLKSSGLGMEHVIKAVIYLTDFDADFKKVSAIRDKWFAETVPKPVSTCVGSTEFSRKGAKIEVEVTALAPK